MLEIKMRNLKFKNTIKNLKFLILTLNSAFCILNFTFISGCQNKPLSKEVRVMMGTFIEVKSTDPKAAGIVFDEIKRIEGLLSKYKPDSEISRLNKEGSLRVGPETFYIIKKAKEFSQASNGAFDITVGPLVDLWGFTNKQCKVPGKEEITKTLNLVGSDKIILQEDNNVVKLKIPGMILDLGGIAKGYAVDCSVKKLREKGVKSALINAGGNIYALGDNYGRPWKIAVQDPRSKKSVKICIELVNQAVATSGDYEQFFIHQGKRYCHIFNPKTGYPVQANVISVTVVAPDAAEADALSTALFVLGKDYSASVLNKSPTANAYFIEKKNE